MAHTTLSAVRADGAPPASGVRLAGPGRSPWQPRSAVLRACCVLAACRGVACRGAACRMLRADGRPQDPEVQQAVAELKARKQLVTDLQQRLQDILKAAAEASMDGSESDV